MGHGSSKELPGTESTNSEGGSTRFSRMKQKLHVHTKDQHHPHLRRIFRRISVSRGNGSSSSSTSALKLVSVEDFAGIALLTLISADMQFKDRWLACVSLGEQTFRTHISHQLTPSLVFPSLPAFLLFVVLIFFFFLRFRTHKPVWNSVTYSHYLLLLLPIFFFLPIIKYTIEKSAIKIDMIFCHAGKEAYVREKWASSCQDFCFRGQQLPYFRPIYCLPLFLHHHALACLD
jgi:hypothetical protein